MSLKNDRYTYCVTWSDDDNEYVTMCGVSQPELVSGNSGSSLEGYQKSCCRYRRGYEQ